MFKLMDKKIFKILHSKILLSKPMFLLPAHSRHHQNLMQSTHSFTHSFLYLYTLVQTSIHILTLNASIATSRLLFSSAEMFKKPQQTYSKDPDQTAPIGAVCSGFTLFASILNSSVMLGNYLQQTTSADNIFRCTFFSVL